MEEDIYDFSGLSLDDLDPSRAKQLQNGGNMKNGVSDGGRASTALFEGNYEEEEWYPPTPPPYDVGDKLTEANRQLLEDPTSDVHVADRLRWRRSSSLVDICWLHRNGDGRWDDGEEEDVYGGGSSSGEEIVVIDDLSSYMRVGGCRFIGEERPPGLAEDEDWSTSESVSIASARLALANLGIGNAVTTNGKEKGSDVEEEIEEEVDCEEEDDLVSRQQNCDSGGSGRRGYVPNGHNTEHEAGGAEEDDEEEKGGSSEETTTPPSAVRDSRKKGRGGEGDGSGGKRGKALQQPPHLITSSSGQRRGKGHNEDKEGKNKRGASSRNGGSADSEGKIRNGRITPPSPPLVAINGKKVNSNKSRIKRSGSYDKTSDSVKAAGSPTNKSSTVLDRRRNSGNNSNSNNNNSKKRSSSATSRRLPNSQSLPELNYQESVNGTRSSLFRRRNSSSPSPSSSLSPGPPPERANGKKSAPSTKAPLMLPVPAERKSISFRYPNKSPSTLRGCSSAPLLQRKISRNSLSSNSSLSSHSTEDSDSSRARQLSREAADQAFSQWRHRKREEKRLRERRTALLQAQLRAKLLN